MAGKGTILFFNATLTVLEHRFYQLEKIKELIERSTSYLGLRLRRTVTERYGENKAFTMIGFLDESHILVTTYPEYMVAELEIASCKTIELESYVGWLSKHELFVVHNTVVLSKDEQGKWSRSI